MQWISTYKSIEYPECYGGGYTVDTLWNILWCTSDDIHQHIHWIFTRYPLLLYGGYALDIKVDIHWFLIGGYPHEDPLDILWISTDHMRWISTGSVGEYPLVLKQWISSSRSIAYPLDIQVH